MTLNNNESRTESQAVAVMAMTFIFRYHRVIRTYKNHNAFTLQRNTDVIPAL